MGEVKRHPYTSVAALACVIALPVVWTFKANASDVDAVVSQVAQLSETVKREATQSELRAVERELFDISFRISTLERENQGVDALLYRRRDDLRAQQRRLEALLQAMEAKQ